MKIRIVSDLHSALNMTYAPTEFVDIMSKKERADVTLIAGDMDADIDEARSFLQTYFPDERVIFVGGNHIVYNYRGQTLQDLLENYTIEFNGQWKFLENDYTWINENLAVIGCIGWTDFQYGHQSRAQYIRQIEKERAYRESHKTAKSLIDGESDVEVHYMGELPDDPGAYYDESNMGNLASYRGRRMKEAARCMNDYNFGKYFYKDQIDLLRPSYTYDMHKQSMKEIKRCYDEIVRKNPDASIILMTHHPFTTKCVAGRFKDDLLTSAFVSCHDKWLKQFENIDYVVCGHVHTRHIGKVAGDKQLVCNSMGYLAYYEHIQDVPFNINMFIEV